GFLGSEHTLAHFRGAFFEPSVLVRMQRSGGAEETVVRRAEKTVERILSSHREPILEEDVERELLKIEERYSS
ncbi:MAG: hypothetical protein EHM36_04625, partial [Deltaproteobacteria bacterium]